MLFSKSSYWEAKNVINFAIKEIEGWTLISYKENLENKAF